MSDDYTIHDAVNEVADLSDQGQHRWYSWYNDTVAADWNADAPCQVAPIPAEHLRFIGETWREIRYTPIERRHGPSEIDYTTASDNREIGQMRMRAESPVDAIADRWDSESASHLSPVEPITPLIGGHPIAQRKWTTTL